MNSNRHWTRARSASIILSATVATTLVATAPHASGAARPESAGPTVVRGAAAVGRLAPTGCVHDAGAGTDVCDLYAMAGTNQVLGHDIPIWGFSTDGTAGSATAPGPLLVVGKGDTVTVRLHNKLDKPVSLAFPGQPAGAFTAGLDSSTTGAAPHRGCALPRRGRCLPGRP
jgi:FtsP/CotA-like multicopper oxidase with cupredoxin domain